jgi:hypothetical protein
MTIAFTVLILAGFVILADQLRITTSRQVRS